MENRAPDNTIYPDAFPDTDPSVGNLMDFTIALRRHPLLQRQ